MRTARDDGDPVRQMLPGYQVALREDPARLRAVLLERLDADELRLPPLRDRRRDVPEQLRCRCIITEHGFTLGSPDEERERFDGDRVLALKSGRARPWTDIEGTATRTTGAPTT